MFSVSDIVLNATVYGPRKTNLIQFAWNISHNVKSTLKISSWSDPGACDAGKSLTSRELSHSDTNVTIADLKPGVIYSTKIAVLFDEDADYPQRKKEFQFPKTYTCNFFFMFL